MMLAACLLVLPGCDGGTPPEQQESLVFRVGVLPDRGREEAEAIYRPLLAYISERTMLDFRLVFPGSYQELLDLFEGGDIDIARFGAYTFARARQSGNPVALVQRDTDREFHSVILVRQESMAQSLADLEGSDFSFGSELSTSGHLMPRYFLQNEHDIVPEAFFGSIRFSGSHDLTAKWVMDGVVDAGVANALIVEDMFDDGRLREETVRVIWISPPYADYVWAANERMSEADRIRIIDAFLSLSSTTTGNRQILDGVNADYYLPVNAAAYDRITSIIDLLESQGSL